MRMFSNKKIAAVAIAAVALTGTGVAYAWWTTDGAGSVSGTAANAEGTDNVDLTGTITTTATSLVPGSPDHEVELTVENPNSYSVSLLGQTLTLTSVTCDTTVVPWFTLSDAVIGSSTIVAPGATTALALEDVQVSFADAPLANQDVCQNAVVTLNFDVA